MACVLAAMAKAVLAVEVVARRWVGEEVLVELEHGGCCCSLPLLPKGRCLRAKGRPELTCWVPR